MSQNQKQLIAKKANELQKRQDIESKDGMYFFTEAEFIHHWKGRIGLNEKDGRKLYVKESNAVDAVWEKKRGTWLLGVWKPPEVNANEILSRNVGIKSGGTMKSLMNSAAAKKIASSLGSGLKKMGGIKDAKMMKALKGSEGNADSEEEKVEAPSSKPNRKKDRKEKKEKKARPISVEKSESGDERFRGKGAKGKGRQRADTPRRASLGELVLFLLP